MELLGRADKNAAFKICAEVGGEYTEMGNIR